VNPSYSYDANNARKKTVALFGFAMFVYIVTVAFLCRVQIFLLTYLLVKLFLLS